MANRVKGGNSGTLSNFVDSEVILQQIDYFGFASQ